MNRDAPCKAIIDIHWCGRNDSFRDAAEAPAPPGTRASGERYTFSMKRPNQFSAEASPVLALLLCVGVLLSGSVWAAAGDSAGVLARVLACRAIRADQARLRCFDLASAALTRSARHAPKPTQQSRADLSPRQTFGLTPAAILAREVANGARPKPLANITERVTGLHVGADGRMIYDLANGQVWRELQNNGDAPPLRIGEPVKISRGWLGSYWLQAPSGRGCKVERIH